MSEPSEMKPRDNSTFLSCKNDYSREPGLCRTLRSIILNHLIEVGGKTGLGRRGVRDVLAYGPWGTRRGCASAHLEFAPSDAFLTKSVADISNASSPYAQHDVQRQHAAYLAAQHTSLMLGKAVKKYQQPDQFRVDSLQRLLLFGAKSLQS
eukprot:766585-Hanusia_phi.AAC.4